MTDLATLILDTVYQSGTRQVFGIPGDAINGLVGGNGLKNAARQAVERLTR